ncbi:MAG: flagellar biosynthetic protein FliR [Dissulfurimicrobium sp.]|uniref:flagellar biosynthetic protein FliR n=1 Tax=Dissulfurimicrobium TaxID=1769732 RepID=UPI001EDB0AFA|nr:flagellar biosynthetic protein FliR [Dissulfurimicrobium hydrothermale]UKL13477.1 flagellar biosynthetic protein FliR [Dissulfurimicrobium hydrothermale]
MEQDLLYSAITHYKVFVLVLIRLSTMLFFMPVFSSATIPAGVKAAISIVTSLMLTPVAPFSPQSLPNSLVGFLLLVTTEAFTGLTLSLILRLIFAGLQTAAQMVGFQMGLSVASVMEPQSGAQSLVVAEFVYLTALTLFLVSNAHHLVIEAIYESLAILPPGGLTLKAPLSTIILKMAYEMFVISVKIMAPVMAILLFSQVALGILAKIVPQINMLILSFGLNIALGLIFLGLTLQIFWPVLAGYLREGIRLIPAAAAVMAGK